MKVFLFTIFLASITNFFSQKGALYQAAYNGSFYEYKYNSIPIISISNAPEDTDWNRWSILFDGENYRLYFMPIGKSDRLYQFGYNSFSEKYEYGYNSVSIIPIRGLPDDANITNFSILFDGSDYRLYFKSGQKKLYQCAYNPSIGTTGAYEFGFHSKSEITIKNAPLDTDWNNWSMLHDGEVYRLYFKSSQNNNLLYQFGFDGNSYVYGFQSDPVIKVEGMPDKNFVKKFNITYDGLYRYYNLFFTN